MPTLKKWKKYRRVSSKKVDSVDIIPLRDEEVSHSIYSQFVEVKNDDSAGRNLPEKQ